MELARDTVVLVNGRPDALWPVLEDVDALCRVLPGCETLEAGPDGQMQGVIAARIQFLTLRADVTATVRDAEPPRHFRLEIDGRPRAFAGSFGASIPVDMEPTEDGGTTVRYAVDLAVTGRLATFGVPILRQTLRAQVAQLVANLERELAARDTTDTG